MSEEVQNGMEQRNPAEILKEMDLKCTRQREAILAVLMESQQYLTAEELYLHLKSVGQDFSLSTVYRTLTFLEQHQLIQKTDIPGELSQYFRFSYNRHRHHLVCSCCKRCIPIEECPVEKFSAQLCEAHGFLMQEHSFEILGICPECRQKKELPLPAKK